MPVHEHRGIWLMPIQDEVHCRARRVHRGIVERARGVQRCITRCHEQLVALTQWNLEPLRETQHHVATRLRTARLDEAQVASGDFHIARKFELTQVAALSPVAQRSAERMLLHGGSLAQAIRASITCEVIDGVR